MKIDSLDRLWPRPRMLTSRGEFSRPEEIRFTGEALPPWLVEDFKALGSLRISENPRAYPAHFEFSSRLTRSGEYEMSVTPDGIRVAAADPAALGYAGRTLEQWLAFFPPHRAPALEIRDAPAFRKRCFMVDMGRSIWRLPLLKRVVRILQRLKMNQLHLHLYDDELCSLRFEGLPFGSENPYALSLAEFQELVTYAAERHVEIVPELEAWGHVGAIVYHRSHLAGGQGMFNGRSFILCEETFELMRELVTQTAACLPGPATIHLGLDEAKWFPGDDLPAGFGPADMVRRYYDIVTQVGRASGKDLTLRVWADHAGRPIPADIAPEIIVEPWCYWNSLREKMTNDIAKYSGAGKPPWMAGAGVSGGQPRGAYHATRNWARNTADSPNIEGINITFWGWNNLDEKLVSLFAGARYLWNPDPGCAFDDLEDYEAYDKAVMPIMYGWQGAFPDADPDAIRRDRGPVVFLGHFHFGGRHLQPVAPTAPLANSLGGHDYLNEHLPEHTETAAPPAPR